MELRMCKGFYFFQFQNGDRYMGLYAVTSIERGLLFTELLDNYVMLYEYLNLQFLKFFCTVYLILHPLVNM